MQTKVLWITWVSGKAWEFESLAAARYWAHEKNGSRPVRHIRKVEPDPFFEYRNINKK